MSRGSRWTAPSKEFGGAGEIAGAFLRDAEKNARTASSGKQLDGFAQRCDGGGGFGFRQQNSEIEIGFGHFRIEGDGVLVFGAGFGDSLERGVGVSELEVGPGDVRFFGEEFLQRSNGGFEIDSCRCRVGLRRGDR